MADTSIQCNTATKSFDWSHAVVTGATGFIGSHMVRALKLQGISVIAVDHWDGSGNDIMQRDLSVPGSLDEFLNPQTALFHFAGSADVQRSVENPLEDFHANTVTTLGLLEACRQNGIAVAVLPSSGSVYDHLEYGPYGEHSATRPSSPYAAAKLACEAYFVAYSRSYNINTRIARLFSVYGPGMRRFAIFDFYRRLIQCPQKLILRGDGKQTRDYIYVEDAVRALLLLATQGTTGEVYNVASGEARSIMEVATSVARRMGLHDCKIVADGIVNPSEVYRMEANISRLQNLGFCPHISFSEGLNRTIEWLNHNQGALK